MTYKVFEAGETLSANDVMTYFMNQIVSQETTFADLAELPADVKVAYVTDDDSVYALLGSTWTKLAYNGENFTVDDLTVTGNLTVQGTTTTIDSTTIAVKDKFVFEGATADAHETTLQVAEPTADRTITLPDATGTVALTSGLYALPSQTGNSGKFLTTNGSADSWGTVDLTTKTDKSTLTTTGDIYYASAANTPARLGIGTTGQNLVVASGIPSWATPSGGGKVLQAVFASTTTVATSNTTTYADTTLTATITPTLNTSKVMVLVTQNGLTVDTTLNQGLKLKLLRGSTDLAIVSDNWGQNTGNQFLIGMNASINWLDSPATTSATTYKTQFARTQSSGTVYVQSATTTATSSIILLEVGA